MSTPQGTNRAAGPVRVILADDEPGVPRRRIGIPPGFRIASIMLAALLASAGVIIGVRLARAAAPPPSTPSTSLDAKSAPTLDATRLVPVGPRAVADTSEAAVDLAVGDLPQGTTAVALEVSIVKAARPGTVAVGADTVLRVPKAGASTSATAIVPVGADGKLAARTESGGRLLVNLVGAFVAAESATAGRIVATPPTEVLRLVPRSSGKDAEIDLANVPALRDAASYSAVLLQVAADVGVNGGSLAVGRRPKQLDQQVFWAATSGTDRTRSGFLIVPADGGSIHLHYQAGSLLTADLVGYVTGDQAPDSVAGLVVPVRQSALEPLKVGRGASADLSLVALDGSGAAPADRVAAALVTLSAVGASVGAVAVHPPSSAPPRNPILSAGGNAPRAATTLVRADAGQVRVTSAAGATATVTPQALILNG